jgi:hypothetical protein
VSKRERARKRSYKEKQGLEAGVVNIPALLAIDVRA